MKNKLVLFLLIFMGLGINLLVRVVDLAKSPLGVTWDEAGVGFNSYSLLKTGKDEYGVRWPLIFRSLGDYKPAFYSYLSMVPIKVLGLNIVSTRLVSALAGTLALVSLGLWLNLFVKNKYLVWILVALIGLGPVRLHFSRMALETNLSSMFFGFGSYWWIKSKRWLGLGAMILAMWSYHSAKMAAPMLFILMSVDPFAIEWKKKFLINMRWLLVGLVILVFVVYASGKGGGGILTRYQQENFLQKSYPFAPGDLFKFDVVSYLRLNPIYYLLGNLTGHLTAYLSPANFSTNNYPWLKDNLMFIPQTSWMGFWELIFLPIGIVVVFVRWREKYYRYLIYLYLAVVAPSVITWSWLNTLRGLSILPVMEITCVLGSLWVAERVRWKRLFMLIWLLFAVWEGLYNINNVLAYTPTQNTDVYFAHGLGMMAKIVKGMERDYEEIILDTSQEHAQQFWMFYMAFPPQEMQKLAIDRIQSLNNAERGFNFGKYVFRKVDWEKDKSLRGVILWQEGNSMTKDEEISAVGGEIIKVRGPTQDEVAGQLVILK